MSEFSGYTEKLVVSPKDRFDKTLNAIAEHPFVTPETHGKRKELEAIVTRYRNSSPEASIVCVPYGSVGVGLANKESDLDGMIFAENGPTSTQDLLQEFSKLHLPHKSQHVEASIWSQTLQNALTETHIDMYFAGPQGQYDMNYRMAASRIEDAALIFGPTLSEFTDPAEQRIVTQWRKDFLEQLNNRFPDKAEAVWEGIQQYLKETFVTYEENNTGAMIDKRRERVRKSLISTIRERFPGNFAAQRRARAMIAHKRDTFSYPSYRDMLTAFDVEHASENASDQKEKNDVV